MLHTAACTMRASLPTPPALVGGSIDAWALSARQWAFANGLVMEVLGERRMRTREPKPDQGARKKAILPLCSTRRSCWRPRPSRVRATKPRWRLHSPTTICELSGSGPACAHHPASYAAIANDGAFLEEHLRAAAETDDFTAQLLRIHRTVPSHTIQPIQCAVVRSDYMLHQPGECRSRFLCSV